jgi:glucokinase
MLRGDVVGVDIGGSGVRAARLVDGCLGPLAEEPLAHAMPVGEVAARILAAMRGVVGGPVSSVGFSFPAFLDDESRVRDALNLPGLNGMDLRSVAQEAFGLVGVAIVPDSAAAALAEARVGSGRGARRVLTVVIGTGCNAGMTVDGEIVDLAGGSLGDAGHGGVTLRDVECWCGGRGCLEAHLSGAAFDLRAPVLGLADRRALLAEAQATDGAARAVVREAGAALGAALAGWSAMLWPDRVVVGGGVGLACGEPLLESARAELQRTGADHLVSAVEIVASQAGPGGPLLGACLAAEAAVREDTHQQVRPV